MFKILVIDDDPTGTELLITLLSLEGYEGFGVDNWSDLLGEIVAKSPDLVIMDVRLSGRDGLELLRQLRLHSLPRVASVPVLIMSGEDHRADSRSAGANGFVEKPFDWYAVRGVIERIKEGVY